MVLHIFNKKQASPPSPPPAAAVRDQPAPLKQHSKARKQVRFNQPADTTKGIVYSSPRIAIPGSQLGGSATPQEVSSNATSAPALDVSPTHSPPPPHERGCRGAAPRKSALASRSRPGHGSCTTEQPSSLGHSYTSASDTDMSPTHSPEGQSCPLPTHKRRGSPKTPEISKRSIIQSQGGNRGGNGDGNVNGEEDTGSQEQMARKKNQAAGRTTSKARLAPKKPARINPRRNPSRESLVGASSRTETSNRQLKANTKHLRNGSDRIKKRSNNQSRNRSLEVAQSCNAEGGILPYPVNDDILSIIVRTTTGEGCSGNGGNDANDDGFRETTAPARATIMRVSPPQFSVQIVSSSNSSEPRASQEQHQARAEETSNPGATCARETTTTHLAPPEHPFRRRRESFDASSMVTARSFGSSGSIYGDAPFGRNEAVACILERTGSTRSSASRQRGARRQAAASTSGNSEQQNTIVEEPRGASDNLPLASRQGTRDRSFNPERNMRNTQALNVNQTQTQTRAGPSGGAEAQIAPLSSSFAPNPSSVQSESQAERITRTREAIIARLNQRIDLSQYPTELTMQTAEQRQNEAGLGGAERGGEGEAPPPLDEYAHVPSTPPYRERLHKRVDLISFDPRYHTPVIRINRNLVKTPKNLRQSIRKMDKLQVVPHEINLWEVSKVDDLEFLQNLPQLFFEHEVNEALASSLRASRHQQQQEELMRLEYEQEISRALAISMEEQAQRQLFRSFRYHGAEAAASREEVVVEEEDEGEEEEDDDDNDNFANEDEFVNVDEALRAWHQSQVASSSRTRTEAHPVRPVTFNYLLPAHARSSASSYMTAY
ncbi:uncharacterized protein LODBEIA_P25810 [Lodderomyces beijingensis]|uniref:GLTSCR protein conserved domain-containing protein n=1 Tax=Lodderomyces beijingensis TaxID=1775926 RepID=A0ABP0ZQ87_9ASCO